MRMLHPSVMNESARSMMGPCPPQKVHNLSYRRGRNLFKNPLLGPGGTVPRIVNRAILLPPGLSNHPEVKKAHERSPITLSTPRSFSAFIPRTDATPRSGLFRALPEFELPRRFKVNEARKIIRRIRSVRR